MTEPKLPKRFSASASDVFSQCPRKWRFKYVDKLPDPPGVAAIIGSFAHNVLEHLMERPSLERNPDIAREIATELWAGFSVRGDFRSLRLDKAGEQDFKKTVWRAVGGYFSLEDPGSVEVSSTEQRVYAVLEDVPFLGIVDRLDIAKGGHVVSDYKTGKPPSFRFKDDKLAQVLLYSAALAENGFEPVRARLLYIGNSAIILETDASASSRSSAVESINQVWSSLNDAVKTDSFKANTQTLCGWCPYITSCEDGAAYIRSQHSQGLVKSHATALTLLGLIE